MKIEICNISKMFKDNVILDDINMTLLEGNIYGFKGRNGSGKSVLLKIMCDLISPTKGEVRVNGKNILGNACQYNIGALIENPTFFANLSGYDNLKLLAEIKNIIDEEEINKALDIVNLKDEKMKKYGKYSLGMKQKLGIAQAIMEDQKIILLDEAFNGIEDDTVIKIKKYLKVQKEKGKIIVITSHIKEDLEELCDKIYFFKNGKVDDYEK